MIKSNQKRKDLLYLVLVFIVKQQENLTKSMSYHVHLVYKFGEWNVLRIGNVVSTRQNSLNS